jgi:DNA repair protein RadA/Sms
VRNTPLPGYVIAIGEVALSGDIRPVPHLDTRVAEAMRLGYTRILVPSGSRERLTSAAARESVTELAHLDSALKALNRIATVIPLR